MELDEKAVFSLLARKETQIGICTNPEFDSKLEI